MMTVPQAHKAGFLLQCAHLGVRADVAESLYQKRASKEALVGGKADKKPDSAFSRSELHEGIEEEAEHTGAIKIRKEIAKDHLAEDPRYYTKLERMEKKAGSTNHKWAFLGSALGAATNVGLQAGRGALSGVSGAMDVAGNLGDTAHRVKLDEELKTPHLPAVRNMIVAEHYRRALRALQEARGA